MEQTTSPRGDGPLPPAGAAGPHPASGPGAGTPTTRGFFDSLRDLGLVRTQHRWIGGVAGGIARRLGVDPLLVRGVLAVTVLVGGAGLVLYGLGWALLPEESDGRIHLQETGRGRFPVALLGAVALVIVGAQQGTGWWTGGWDRSGSGWFDGVLWLAVIGAVVALVVSGSRRGGAHAPVGGAPDGRWPDGGWPPPPPPPPPAATAAAPHPGYGPVPLAPPPASGWAGSPVGSAPSGPPPSRPGPPTAPPPPAGAPRPPRPRVPGPGVAVVGPVLGLALLALAALLAADREGLLDRPVGLTALGIGIALTGLGIMVSGARGRRSGVLGLLAVLGVVAAVPAAVVAHAGDRGDPGPGGPRVTISSGRTWQPDSRAAAERGLSVGVGDVRVDLTQVPLDGGPVEVPLALGAGELVVVVPADVAVTGEVLLRVGEVRWDVDGTQASAGLLGDRPVLYTSDEASDGDVDLAVRITAGAADIRVEEDR